MEKKKDKLPDKNKLPENIKSESIKHRGYFGEIDEIKTTIHNIAFDFYRIPGKAINPDLKHNLRMIDTDPLIFTYCHPEGKKNTGTMLNPYPTKMNGYKKEFSNEKGNIDDKTFMILKEIERYLAEMNIYNVYCIVILPYIKQDLDKMVKEIKEDFKNVHGCTIRENYMIRNSKIYEKNIDTPLLHNTLIDENNNLTEEFNNLADKFNYLELNDKIINSDESYWKTSRLSKIIEILPDLIKYKEEHPEVKSCTAFFKIFQDKDWVKKTTLIEFLNKWIFLWNKLYPEELLPDPGKNNGEGKQINKKTTLRSPKTATALFKKLTSENIKYFIDSIPRWILHKNPDY